MNLQDIYARIERRLSVTQQSASAASERAGLSKDAIRNIRRGLSSPDRKGVSTRTIELLAESLRTTPEWLMRGIGDEVSDQVARVQYAPLLSWVQAGKVTNAEVEFGIEAERVPLTNLPISNWIALTVRGDSMDRVAPEGSLIIVDTKIVDPVPRQFFVFDFGAGETTFKRFMDNPPRLEPFSTNPNHETIFAEEPYVIVGRVRRVVRDL